MAEFDLTDEDVIETPESASRPATWDDFELWMESEDWLGVDSSWCRAIKHRKRDGKLLVKFKPSKRFPTGFVAGYNVPMSIFKGMWDAPSKGMFVHAHLYKLPYTDETHTQ